MYYNYYGRPRLYENAIPSFESKTSTYTVMPRRLDRSQYFVFHIIFILTMGWNAQTYNIIDIINIILFSARVSVC